MGGNCVSSSSSSRVDHSSGSSSSSGLSSSGIFSSLHGSGNAVSGCFGFGFNLFSRGSASNDERCHSGENGEFLDHLNRTFGESGRKCRRWTITSKQLSQKVLSIFGTPPDQTLRSTNPKWHSNSQPFRTRITRLNPTSMLVPWKYTMASITRHM